MNPHEHPVYVNYGQGVDPNMRIREVGIAPKPYQETIPLYGGFSASVRTAKFWAKYKGRPIVLAGDTEFLKVLWREWEEEAKAHGHDVNPGDQAFLLIPQGLHAPDQIKESLDLFSRKVMSNFSDDPV